MSSVLHKALKEAATRNHRSLNGEILARLEASAQPSVVNVSALLARIEARRVRTGDLALGDEELRSLKETGRA